MDGCRVGWTGGYRQVCVEGGRWADLLLKSCACLFFRTCSRERTQTGTEHFTISDLTRGPLDKVDKLFKGKNKLHQIRLCLAFHEKTNLCLTLL